MMIADSGSSRSRAVSCSSGNFPCGDSLKKAARDFSSPRSTMTGSNGVSFS